MTSKSGKKPLDFKRVHWGTLHRDFTLGLLKDEGSFLVRRGGEGNDVVSVNRKGKINHFKSENIGGGYAFDGAVFGTVKRLIENYYETGDVVTQASRARLLVPVYNTSQLIKPDRLAFTSVLGRGNFGQVWQGLLSSEISRSSSEPDVVAVKVLSSGTTEKDREECMAEAQLMSLLEHDNIVRMRGLCFFPNTEAGLPPQLCIIMECCNMGPLNKMVKDDGLHERGKLRAILDAALGLDYLHKHDIIHRDVASRNVLLMQTGKRLVGKVADFGLSRLAPEHYAMVTKRRLPVYSTPPESLRLRDWAKSSDVWGFGILVMEVYNNGKNPYEVKYASKLLPEMLNALLKGKRETLPESMPMEIKEVVKECMAVAHERPTMAQVAERLQRYHNMSRASDHRQ